MLELSRCKSNPRKLGLLVPTFNTEIVKLLQRLTLIKARKSWEDLDGAVMS